MSRRATGIVVYIKVTVHGSTFPAESGIQG